MTTAPTRVGVNLVFLEPGRLSGTATYSWSIVRQLARRDDLELVLFVQDGHVPDDELADACEIVSCPRFSNVFGRVAWEQLLLPRRARAARVDVLFSTGYVSPLLGRYAKVVTVHDLYYARWPEAVPPIRRWYYRIFIRASVRVCDGVVAVSQNTRDDLAILLPASVGKTTVVHEAARDDLALVDAIDPGVTGPYFLMVASVTHNKNVETVVQAAAELRRRGATVTVQVVGEDPYDILAEAIAAHRAGDVIVAVGEVDDRTLAGYYRRAVAVILPSRYEGFGLPALEAQAMGAPLLSSRGGALPEVVGDGALLFDDDRVDQLVDAMAAVLDDPGLRASLIESGHHNRSRFSWRRAGDETAAVLHAATERR